MNTPAGQVLSAQAQPAEKPKSGRLRRLFAEPPYRGLAILSPLLLIALWELGTRVFKVPTVILPPPSLVAVALWSYAVKGSMWIDAIATFRRVVIGLIIGGGLGVLVGLLMGWYPRVRAALNPIVASTFPVPKIALLPLLMIWFGMDDAFKIALVAVGVFFIILTNTIAGVDGMSRTTIMAVQNLGANDFQLLYKAVLPAAFPVIMAGIKISFSISLVLVIASEMVLSRNGIGNFLVNSGQILDVESIFAGLIVTACMGLFGYAIFDLIERFVMPGRPLSGPR
jgi:ABC-type nitrate/sulfonate/bicarbonate transport system permease component